ncbi:MAG: aminopeptidase P family protein [Solirubrobacterales bacterium]|nr:aminopeptidase P family protein [Solirubrobacterales bacterium]
MRVRPARLVEILPEAGVDLLLVTAPFNVRYLTGYTGSNGIVLLGERLRIFITDFRYVEQAAEEVDPSFERRRAPLELIESVADVLPGGALRLAFEDAHVSVRQHARLRELLPDDVELVGTEELVERLRMVKELAEVEAIRAASAVADAAFEQLLSEGLVGRTEREVALALEAGMRERGAQRASFETIVASGPRGALPHAQARDVTIERGELVVIDWGAELDGYCSDCTRTIATNGLGDQGREVYELVRTAQLAGLEAVAAGRSAREVDGVAREVIENGGYGERFGHGLGHGVGLEVHERPRLSQRSQDALEAGNVVTVEPGVYLPGELGVRIEDLVVVTEQGCEILTSSPKELRTVQ